ncbi:MAG: DNA-protecting protein DprA [Gemmatimonadetes bacterium]|nr:DNA-protecting protein DprA [Gemmatimonadota bacterium]
MLPRAELDAYLCLALTPGLGPVRLAALRRAFGSYATALLAPRRELRAVDSMNAEAAAAVAGADPVVAAAAIESTQRIGAVTLTPFDRQYPESLRLIADPPPVLFCLGRLELLDRPAVAIVGTRRPTPYGVQVTRDVAAAAAGGGLAVVSGMARGLDAVAHWAAVGHPGSTVGVLGNGLAVVYPASNQSLYQRIARDGLLVSEYPPNQRPHRGSFLARNRVISGLARVTVVTEAPHKSGALDTIDKANEQSREVLVVPGPITSDRAAGSNELLRFALPYLGPADLFAHYPGFGATGPAAPRGGPALPPRLKTVFAQVDETPRSVDELARSLQLESAAVAAVLTELEVAGLVATGPGGGFTRSS